MLSEKIDGIQKINNKLRTFDKMRILLIAQFSRFGGTREVFKRILNIHQSKGYKTHVLIEAGSDEEIKQFITEKGSIFTELPKRGEIFDTLFLSLFYEQKNFTYHLKKWKPDLVVASIGNTKHAHYLFTQKIPLVYILHTIPINLRSFLRYYYKTFSLMANKNQWICGVSKATIDSVKRNWGFREDQTAVLHNTFNKKHIESNTHEKSDGKITVLTLGHVVEYKNPHLWLKVARKVAEKYENVRFVWLGDGNLLKEFQDRTKDETQIEFLGYSDNVKEYYSEGSIYFQPSIIENHSLSVLDAMANGLPCVVSNVGGQPECIEDETNGYLCKYDDASEFIERLSSLIENKELRQRMGQKGKLIAYKKFNPEMYGERLLEIYKNVLKSV